MIYSTAKLSQVKFADNEFVCDFLSVHDFLTLLKKANICTYICGVNNNKINNGKHTSLSGCASD